MDDRKEGESVAAETYVRPRRRTLKESFEYVGSYRAAAIYRWYTGAHSVTFRYWQEFNETLPPGQNPWEYIDHIYKTTHAVDSQTHGWSLRDGKRPSQEQWDRWCAAAHLYNAEHGWGGVRHVAEANGLNERTLARHLVRWRKERGITTNQMRARQEYLARQQDQKSRKEGIDATSLK